MRAPRRRGRARSRERAPRAALALLALACACADAPSAAPGGDDRPRSPPPALDLPRGLASSAALAAVLPGELGTFRASADAETDLERGVAPTSRASRSYVDADDRTARLRIVDAARSPDLVAGFAAAQQIAIPGEPGDDELLPTGIAGRPALASWAPAAQVSEAQALVADRIVVALSITPARAPDEAVELLERFDFARLAALAQP